MFRYKLKAKVIKKNLPKKIKEIFPNPGEFARPKQLWGEKNTKQK